MAHLGYAKFEKNLKRCQLNDQTLLLWDTTALQEAKIPAGPWLVILNHIATKGRRSDIPSPAIPVGGK